MSIFLSKHSRCRSDEYLPLLLSEDEIKQEKRTHRIAQSDFQVLPNEWEIRVDDGEDEDEFLQTGAHETVKLNNIQAVISLVKASMGTGILALPSALRYAGWLLGSFAVLFLSLASIYCMRLLLKVVAHLRSTYPEPIKDLDYEKTVKLCFECSKPNLRKYYWMHYVLYGSLLMAEVSFLTSYHIFIAENMRNLINEHVSEQYRFSVRIYQLCFFVLLLPLVFIKTLDKLSYFCQLANVLIIISLVIVLVYCFQDPLPLNKLSMIKLSDSTPLFFGIVIFAFESINLINPIESHMKNKDELLKPCGVVNTGTSIVLVCYLVVGFAGYWKFGEEISSSVILSMPTTPWYNLLCKPLYIVSILISYALQSFVLISVIWIKMKGKFRNERNRKVCEILLRVGIVASTTILSVTIPQLDLFISLFGSIGGGCITLIFPAICHSVMVYSTQQDKFWKLHLVFNSFLFCLGVFGACIGCYSSIVNIIRTFS